MWYWDELPAVSGLTFLQAVYPELGIIFLSSVTKPGTKGFPNISAIKPSQRREGGG